MCGRYTVFTEDEDSLMTKFLKQAGFKEPVGDIFPTDPAPIITAYDGKIRAKYAFWGFPSPSGDSKPVINSRSETAVGKRFFREALYQRRCVIPATGFYEWSRESKLKYFFKCTDDDIMYMAGAYNDYGPVKKFVIFTRGADDDMADVHNRMPVLLTSGTVREYLTQLDYFERAFILAPPRLYRSLAE